jgi:glycosyltransferase involved in cell wall biosynthesis
LVVVQHIDMRERAQSPGREPLVPKVSIVLPSYNTGTALRRTLFELLDEVESRGGDVEVIVVHDGSTDGSEHALDDVEDPRVRSVRRVTNGGKGEAIRQGFALSCGSYIGFMDSDGDIAPRSIQAFLQVIDEGEADVISGSKSHPDSHIEATLVRRLYSVSFRLLTRVLFGLRVHDTQTGIKFVRADLVKSVLRRMSERGFAFDVELFVALSQSRELRIVELPVEIRKRTGSTIRLRSIVRIAFDVARIYLRLRRGAYQPSAY